MIRTAKREDASRLAEILIFAKRTAYRNIFNNDEVSFGEMQVLPLALQYQGCLSELEHIFVYEDVFVKGMINIDVENNFLEIKELYVDPFFQNQSIGSELLLYIFNYAKKLGMTEIALWVLEKNQIGKRFYKKYGFSATNEKILEAGTTEYILKFVKVL